MKKILLLFVISTFLFVACNKDKDEDKTYSENQEVNSWITSIMKDAYLWTKYVPSSSWNTESESDPINYFKSLLYSNEDYWSYITDDYAGLLAELNGTPKSIGYFPMRGSFTNSNNAFLIIGYVYPNSPADNAGLKRGDIILKINGITLTQDNFYDLVYQNSINATMGVIQDGIIIETSIVKTIDAVVLDVNPAIKDEVYSVGGKNIGYLAITEFISEEGFKFGVGAALERLKGQGIEDLIVDLRYNLGGSLASAAWLASALVPEAEMENQSLLTTLKFNETLQAIYNNDPSIKYRFEYNASNLGLNRIYFLTTGFSASASELVISGLDPYMEVVTVGDQSHGKWVGSSLFPAPNETLDHNYGMLPIMFKYENALNQNVKGGITPNHLVYDMGAFYGIPLGDKTDPMIAKALELITGVVVPEFKDAQLLDQMRISPIKEQKQKMNLIVDKYYLN